MSLSNDIPTKLRVPAQLALDAKSVVTTLSQLQTLGADNNLAYTYYKGMPVICAENLGLYRWRPVEEGETGGTLASNFIYPAGIVSEDGVVYSNIAYNFFKETILTVENLTELIQINNVGEGVEIYKDSTIVGDTTQFNLKSLKLSQLGGGAEVIRELQDLSDEILFINRTLVSDSNSIDITVTDNTISLDINNVWLISFLQSNSNTLCEIFSNCTGDPIIEQGNFGYSSHATAACLNSCTSTDLVQVYRDNVFGRFEQATMLSTDLAMTISAPVGYYAEFSTKLGDSVSRYWDGSNLGVPFLCGCTI